MFDSHILALRVLGELRPFEAAVDRGMTAIRAALARAAADGALAGVVFAELDSIEARLHAFRSAIAGTPREPNLAPRVAAEPATEGSAAEAPAQEEADSG